ncbi:MAG: hypothetical protein HC884_05705 [Chloroflexaceae bacterium]|nr:hypothetical protein [Chloroflexaceae bacterium]
MHTPMREMLRFTLKRLRVGMVSVTPASVACSLTPVVRSFTAEEQTAARLVLGDSAIAWNRVRVVEEGFWRYLTALPPFSNRAFVWGYAIVIPDARRVSRSLIVHEAVHVLQYERGGWGYALQSLVGQVRRGRAFYDYGGVDGLQRALATGKRLRDFNVEQQASLAQHYYEACLRGADTRFYEPFVAELRRGEVWT